MRIVHAHLTRVMNVQGLGKEQMIFTTVPDGDRGTAQTVSLAKQLIAEGLRDPQVRYLALRYVAHVTPGDKIGELEALFDGVRRDFQYRDDPAVVIDGSEPQGAEMLQPLRGLLETRAGDCDDLNLILLPTLAGVLGFRTRGVTIKADPERSGEFSHVYSEAYADGRWFPLDVARSEPAFGKGPEYWFERKDWPLTDFPKAHLNGYPSATRARATMAQKFAQARRGMDALAKRFPRRGLGDDSSFDTSLLNATPGILSGVAQVVKASNTPGIAYSGVIDPTTGQYISGTGLSLTANASSGLYLLGALAVAGLLFVSIKK